MDAHPILARVASLLARHGLRAKKSWGQNFLVDPTARQRIVAAAGVTADDVVVEIGAGLGSLTLASKKLIEIGQDGSFASSAIAGMLEGSFDVPGSLFFPMKVIALNVFDPDDPSKT